MTPVLHLQTHKRLCQCGRCLCCFPKSHPPDCQLSLLHLLIFFSPILLSWIYIFIYPYLAPSMYTTPSIERASELYQPYSQVPEVHELPLLKPPQQCQRSSGRQDVLWEVELPSRTGARVALLHLVLSISRVASGMVLLQHQPWKGAQPAPPSPSQPPPALESSISGGAYAFLSSRRFPEHPDSEQSRDSTSTAVLGWRFSG